MRDLRVEARFLPILRDVARRIGRESGARLRLTLRSRLRERIAWGIFLGTGLILENLGFTEPGVQRAIEPLTLGLLIGGGALLAGGGALAGGIAARPEFSAKDTPTSGFDPARDPVNAALQLQALTELGLPIQSLAFRGSPLQQLGNAIQSGAAGDIRRKDVERVSIGINRLLDRQRQLEAEGRTPDQIASIINSEFNEFARRGDVFRVLRQAVQAAGFSDFEEILNAESQFRSQQGELVARAEALAPQIRAGREAAVGEIARFQQGARIPGAEEFSRVEALQRQALGLEFDRSRQRLLEQANAANINPAAALGLLEESRATQLPVNALQRAIQLLSGQQSVAQQGLSTLQASLQAPTTAAFQAAQLGTASALSGANIASQQATALANLQAQNEFLRDQALGAGISGFGSALSGAAMGAGNIGLLSELGAFKQPGSTGLGSGSDSLLSALQAAGF